MAPSTRSQRLEQRNRRAARRSGPPAAGTPDAGRRPHDFRPDIQAEGLGASSTTCGASFFRPRTPMPFTRSRSLTCLKRPSRTRKARMASARLGPTPGKCRRSSALARFRMTLPSSVMPALFAPCAPSPVPSGTAAGARPDVAGLLAVELLAVGLLAVESTVSELTPLLLARGRAADLLANHGVRASAPSMLESGTWTPSTPLNADAAPTPESASIASASPISLSATGAQTLFRNVARVRTNHEGRAAGASRPPPSSPRGSAPAGEKSARLAALASRAVEAAGDT